jgi:TonB-linked SusC/RagA family outer membrane protein
MRKLTFLLACLLLVGVGLVNAQSKSISGKVFSADDGQPIIGATVKVKNASTGTITNTDGEFRINLSGAEKTLVISYVGMKTVEIEANNNMTVKLASDSKLIDEVVVTAVGIKRSQKALGYSATQVNSADITATGNRSALNALQGKVPGVEISSASGSPGSSTRVIMRGFSSLGGSNQPLFVVDGVPISNGVISKNAIGDNSSINGGFDFGNRANDINPDDIESMTILQGGSATALYGSRAASGVILITTKNGGKANNKAKVDISSTTTFENPLRLPYMQNEFGQGWYDRGGGTADLQENGSWGPRFDGKIRKWGFAVDNQQQIKPYVGLKNNVKDFFDTGLTLNNTVAISNGDDNKSYYMSFGNITSDGIMPTSADSYKRNNLSLRGSTKFLNIFTAAASLNYVRKDTKFVPTGQDQAVLDGIWQSARDISIVDQKDYNNKFNNIDNYFTVFAQNPYFVLNEHGNKFLENRVFGNVSLDAKILPWLTAKFKLGGDVANSSLKTWRAIVKSTRAAYNDDPGQVSEDSYYTSELNTDFMLVINKDISNDLTFSAVLGHNFNQRDARSQGSSVIGLSTPKFYNLSNSAATPSVYETLSKRRLVGAYGSVDLGYKNFLFLNMSARNDWSSTLPSSNRSFFYPSISGSFLFTELLQNKEVLSYGKVRLGLARTGKDADPYQTNNVLKQTSHDDGYRKFQYPLAGGINGFSVSNLIGNPELKPEISTDKEIGLDLKFFNNRVSLATTVYQKNVKDLIWTATLPVTTGYTQQTQNLGEISNKGIEISLSVTPIKTKDLEWEISANFSKNKNLLVSLQSGLDQISLGGTSSIGFVGRPGQELGLFEGTVPALSPKGQTIVNAQGLPVFSDTKEIIGSSQNKFRIGGASNLTYKGFTLHASIDYRNGGKMYSRTKEILYFTGNAQATTYNDRQPFIIPNSVQKMSDGTYAENTVPIAGFTNNLNLFYNQSYNAGVGGAYALVDKTFFKLREVTLSYSLPKTLLAKTSIRSLEVALVGNNLLLWTPDSNQFVDPEMTTFGNDMAADFGDYGATPSTRSIGFNVKIGF